MMVAGIYRLGAVLHRSDGGAIYETEFGGDARPAVIKIRWGEAPESEQLAARWRDAIELAHPNLLRLYAAGSSVLDEVPIVYVVMERAEESLDGVLGERSLSEAETREMLPPTLAALGYLHKNGYAHSSLKPSNILAARDVLKLSSDSVRKVGDGGAPAEDIRALGALIEQALKRDASEPLKDIVRHCLEPDPDKRWTVDQVAARLDAREEPPRLLLPVTEEPHARSEDRGERGRARRSRKWMYGAVAALVPIAILVGLGRRQDSGPARVASIPAIDRPVPALPLPTPVSKVPKPADHPKRAAEVKPATPRALGRRAEGWTVVVASYLLRPAAEHQVREMARKWPMFKLSVFEQKADKTYYLVVIGQNLSEDEAEALRKRAVAAGLPRDAYIKRFL